jgi:hypothetical protein
MTGVIHGGWSYVIAAYLATALGLLVYGASLWTRLRSKS